MAETPDSPQGRAAFLEALVDNSTDAVTVLDANGQAIYTSPAAAGMYGYPEGYMEERSAFEFVHPEDVDEVVSGFVDVMAEPALTVRREFRMRCADETWLRVESVATNRLHDPAVCGIVINTRDVSDRARAEEALRNSEERYRRLVELSPEAIAVHQLGVFVYINPAGLRLLGAHSDDELLGRPMTDVVHPDDVEGLDARLQTLEGATDSGLVDRRLVRLDGAVIDVELVAVHIVHDGAPATQVIARDVSDRKRAERALAHQALHDHLTGLPNRTLLLDRLAQALFRTTRSGCGVAVLFLDLDRFKLVNDDLGHEAGDRVLQAVAARITNVLRPADTLARFGGDEFVVVCDDVTGAADASEIAVRIVEALALPMGDSEDELRIGASVGVALGSGSDATPEALIRDADAAMYRAKERGRGRVELFDEGMRLRLVSRIREERRLRQAIVRDELRLYYQPVLTLPHLEVAGVEALVRWQHPDRGLILPGEFIPIAEESGLIIDLGAWVLEEGCRQARAWAEAPAMGPIEVAVNLSTRQLSDEDLVKRVADLLQRHDLEPGQVTLCMEITESLLLEDPFVTATVLEELRRLDVRIAIDDFGTGYSSLAYLGRLPVDVLKIDQSFVSGLGRDTDSRPITVAIIELAHALGLQVVAEGVEEQDQLDALIELGCDQAQGFLLARPMPAADIPTFLEGHRAAESC